MMITNGNVNIKGRVCKAYIFAENKIVSDDMGERFDSKVSIRVPIGGRESIGISLGDTILVSGDEWRITGITVNRTGSNPHYRLTGVK